MDALLLVSGFLLLALGFAMGRVWEWEKHKAKTIEVEHYRCCDHCYVNDESANHPEARDMHTVPCGEYVKGFPCPVGNSLV